MQAMEVDEMKPPLPSSEAELLAVLLKMPYIRRTGYAIRLVNDHRENPALLNLIQELLSTTLLPARVPFPKTPAPQTANENSMVVDEGEEYIDLIFPQSTASKRFFQRELGLAMASILGPQGIAFLLEAIVHPSTAGRARAIQGCVTGASDEQLVAAYQKSVPATQKELQEALKKGGRLEVLKALGIWKEVKVEKPLPICVELENTLKVKPKKERETAWDKTGYVEI